MQVKVPSYGADQAGLICGFRFRPGSPGAPIEAAEAVELLASRALAANGEFIWLHFNLTHAATERWLKANLELSEVFFEALHDGSFSTRVEYVDESLVAVTNDVLFDFAYDASHIATLWLSVNERMLVSARRKPLRTVDHLRANGICRS